MRTQYKIDDRLRSIIINTFQIARWAYGAQAVGEDPEVTPPTILLLSKTGDGYAFRSLDEREIPHERGRNRAEEIVDECVRLLVWGLIDYVLTVQECAMFLGTEEENYAFREMMKEKDLFDDEVRDQVTKCCSFALYDLSGVIVRTFATDLCCIRTFIMNSEPLEMSYQDTDQVLPHDDTRMSDDLAELSNTTWVLEEDVDEDLRDVGPLPSWSDSLERVLEKSSLVEH